MDRENRLIRPREGRVLGGVCAAFGEYFELDGTLIRLAWVLLVCLGGTGILAYIVCWIVIPEE